MWFTLNKSFRDPLFLIDPAPIERSFSIEAQSIDFPEGKEKVFKILSSTERRLQNVNLFIFLLIEHQRVFLNEAKK
jgi:hypothetical protein